GAKAEVSGPMVGATMGLLAFLMAFTFNAAAGRHEARRTLVMDEANAVERLWLRANFLVEPYRSATRDLIRQYVDLRVKAISGQIDVAEAVRQSTALQARLWTQAVEISGRKDAIAVSMNLYVQALNDVFDLQAKRVTVGLRSRIAPSIWLALMLLLAGGMIMVGVQVGQSGVRNRAIELALALSFSIVFFTIVDLDRPLEGLIDVSQQATLDLQQKILAR
ncbi:MAG TPA: hypothetical protein VFO19_13685, partial [Vicinamibacterales bacterium]|nr:hypothetical protein [Vicinamibacterales bacterium]